MNPSDAKKILAKVRREERTKADQLAWAKDEAERRRRAPRPKGRK